MEMTNIVLNSLISGLLLGGVLALAALGLAIVLGVMGLVNLAHGEFLIAGGYLMIALIGPLGMHPIVALPLVAALMALLALPLQRYLLQPLVDKAPESSMMTTFGLSIVIQNVYLMLFHADTRSIQFSAATEAIQFGPVSFGQIYLLGFVFSVGVIIAVHLLISRTRFGRDLRASAADPVAAAVVGVNVKRVYGLTVALGAACAGMGGVLIGTIFAFTPSSGASYLLNAFAIVVLGGLGNIFGTLVGGIVLGVLQSLGGVAFGDGYRDLVGLLVLLLVLALRPTGIMGRKGS
jgi:branched-chain amino acid transport system permease protein